MQKSCVFSLNLTHVSSAAIVSYKIILGPDTVWIKHIACHVICGQGLPKTSISISFVLLFVCCKAQSCFFFFFFAFLPPKTSGISIKERRESGQMDGVERDASPQTSNLPSGMCKSRLRIMLNSAALTDLYSVSLCSEGSRGREYVNLLQQFIMGIGLI